MRKKKERKWKKENKICQREIWEKEYIRVQ